MLPSGLTKTVSISMKKFCLTGAVLRYDDDDDMAMMDEQVDRRWMQDGCINKRLPY
jgi:hypothetical protein